MALGRTAKYYRDHPEARAKHNASSKKWNESEKGKKYKKAKNGTEEEKRRNSERSKARSKFDSIPKGYVVDHIKPLAKGGTTAKSNLRLVKAKTNNTKNKK